MSIAFVALETDLFADSMPSSPLTEPAVDIHDVDVEIEPEFDASRAVTSASTSSSLLRRSALRPYSLSSNFFGHSFKQAGYEYTIREKSVLKKSGKPSYTWKHRSKAYTLKLLYLSWLCNIC
jgi:hypothetical protein